MLSPSPPHIFRTSFIVTGVLQPHPELSVDCNSCSPEEAQPEPLSVHWDIQFGKLMIFESPHYNPEGASRWVYIHLWAELFEAITLASLYTYLHVSLSFLVDTVLYLLVNPTLGCCSSGSRPKIRQFAVSSRVNRRPFYWESIISLHR